MTKTENQEAWRNAGDAERSKPKWVPVQTEHVTVTLEAPVSVMVKGKFGERQLYIIDTVEFGKVYVTPAQFCKIAKELAKLDYTVATQVSL